MMMKKTQIFSCILVVLSVDVCDLVVVDAASLVKQCKNEFQKLSPCLPFTAAKVAAPSKECCDIVTTVRKTDLACLCYIIHQIHNGNTPEVKNLGIQVDHMLQLPSACKLANASISSCPKYLGLPPNSPGADIFTNSSAANYAPPGKSAQNSSNSRGHNLKTSVAMAISVAIFSSCI